MKRILTGAAVLAALAGPAAAEDWNLFSRSASNAFFADLDSIVTNEGVTSVRIAMVPLRGDAGDYSHSLETHELQCNRNRWRPAGVVEIGPDGAEADRYPEEGAEWTTPRPDTVPEYLKGIACDGHRGAPPNWPTVQAWVDAGRP